MLRWILIALAIYMLIRLIRGPKKSKQGGYSFQFGRYTSGNNGDQRQKRKQNLDQIEEAEFEDITDKETKK